MDKRWKKLAKLRLKAAAIREEIALLTQELESEIPPKEINLGGVIAHIKRTTSYYVPAGRIHEIKHTLSKSAFKQAFSTVYRFKAGSLRNPKIAQVVKPDERVYFNVTFKEEE